jgi:hypothetical protein
MTRIDMSTREWHGLITPVLAHVGKDKDFPELAVVRLEVGPAAVYAAATDRYTIAAERWPLPLGEQGMGGGEVVHLNGKEAAATLKLFTYGKDNDPPLRITIDTGLVPIQAAGTERSVSRLAVTVEQAGDGTRLVLHDERDPSHDPLAKWRDTLHGAMSRPGAKPFYGLDLNAWVLTRFASACGKGERLTIFSGPESADPILVTVNEHFAGIAVTPKYLEDAGETLAGSPWMHELS